MNRTHVILWLLAGIVVVCLMHFVIDERTKCAPDALRRAVLVSSAGQAKTLVVARPGEPATRLENQGGWKISAPYAASAESSAVLRLIDALAYAPIDDEMSDAQLLRLGRTREDFGLDAPRVTVTVDDAVEVAFGAATPSGDGVYARVGQAATVYVVPSNVFVVANCAAADFRCRRVFGANLDNIVSFDIRSGAGRFARLVRAGDIWKIAEPRDGVASVARVRAFLGELLGLEAKSFVWPAATTNGTTIASASLLAGYGLDSESSVSVTLMGTVDKTGAIVFGREAGPGLVYALVQGGSAIVTVPTAIRDGAIAGMDAFSDPRIFPIEASSVGAISLQDEDSAYLLSRAPDGAWRLDAPVSAAADSVHVAALVNRLLELKTSDIITNGGVRVSLATNAEPVSIARSSLPDGWHPENLRAREIVRFDPAAIMRIVVTDVGSEPVSLIRNAEKNDWSIESEVNAVSVDCAAVERLIAALNPLTARHVARLRVSVSELSGYGLGKPFRTIAIDQTSEGSVRRNILLGDETEGCRYATLGSSDAVFVISGDDAKLLLAPLVR